MQAKRPLPPNFNWKHYLTLNPYVGVPPDNEGASEHYRQIGFANRWTTSYADLDVLVYSAGKTGTTCLATSFLRSGYHVALIHKESDNPRGDPVVEIINYPRVDKLLIVTSYREPVSLHISTFFQNIPLIVGMSNDEFLKQDYKCCESQLLDYLDKISREPLDTNLFTEKLAPNFDHIIIHTIPFDKDLGFAKTETDKIELLLLRFDKMDNWKDIINKYTNKQIRNLIPFNITSKKSVGTLYNQIAESIIISKTVLDSLYDSEKTNMEYFYTEAEIFNIKNRWYSRLY